MKSFAVPDWLIDAMQGLLLIALFAWLFYDSALAVLPLLLFLPFWLYEKRAQRREKAEEQFKKMFREWILLLSSSLSAGYSIEHAFGESFRELQLMFPKGGVMMDELRTMLMKSKNNQRPEELLTELAQRHPTQEVVSFAEVFCAARKSGGSLTAIIKSTSEKMAQVMDTKREIRTMLAAKVYEQKIMTLMPAAVLLYLRVCSAEFLNGLYHNMAGIIVMSVCLGIYFSAYLLGKRMVQFEV